MALLVEKACAKLRSAIGDEAVGRLNFTGDLQEMLVELEVIQPRLVEVEMQLSTERGDEWVWHQRPREASYRLMDMIDDMQDPPPPPTATMQMARMIPYLVSKKNAMATEVDNMKNQLIHLKRRLHSFPVGKDKIFDMYNKPISEPFFKEASVFGRWADKQRIVAVLQSAASNITQGHPSCAILPIFGFPGSGKTTLAQMVFNDSTQSLREYNFCVWVHVSPEFDFHRIGESILLQVVSNDSSNTDAVGMEHIMKRLHKLLNGKKVLLVLDDLWEEDSIQLQLLKSMLTFSGDKVNVIVTTCNQAIARKISTVVQPYMLNPLGDSTCWEIIKQRIRFKEEEEDEELEKIGRKIASKCRGVPLAALEYAGMLSPSRDPKEWEKSLEEIDWFRGCLTSRALFKTLLLCYGSMPPELRLCFDYYSDIFPNGHSIVKDDLIHQWIALNLIEPSERSSAKEIAEGYITRLLDMSFFQTSKPYQATGNGDKDVAIFTMHGVVHDYTRMRIKLYKVCRPYMLATELDNRYDDGLRALRCINCSNMEFNGSFSSQRYLRVLELKESPVPQLPYSISKLRHLGYLKISEFSGLVALPESFGTLTNLFHIDLSSCSALATLPESFGKLIGLVHVNLSGCFGLATLPVSFGDLINLSHVNLSRCHGLTKFPKLLQKLSKLVDLDLSFWSCFEGIEKGLGGLINLEHLNLAHPCSHLAQHRSYLQELKDGLCKLANLRYLNLSMCLNPIFYYHKSQEESFQYIQSFVSGLSSLEHLDLSHNKFLVDLPQCLGDLNRLHRLDLSGCIRLKKVCAMKSLKFIALKNCRALESCNFVVCVAEDDVYSSSNLVQLEDVDCQELQISGLEKVRYTEEAQRIKLVEKQKLEKLKLSWTLDSIRSVEDSALLGELTPPPNLQCLEINGYDGTSLTEYLSDLTSLQELKILCSKQLNSLPNNIEKLTSLKNLCVFGCPELEKWCQLEENKEMLAHIPNKNYGEHASTSRPEVEENGRSINEVETA